ncbi:TonB-dependent receptor [Exilibacterium tricleocarpae]|uniref:TonB-dependent receptor n=1 Tax=Exilibacterium tricleocarpae TaxID=2591008 RepID=A0A545T625_9GAMM|nr:TonB-dependent receptor [Exilibacterium tricleocarpae]TQV72681.1 TonB-dependent receptor [Exilibacterium tricleocarpae]
MKKTLFSLTPFSLIRFPLTPLALALSTLAPQGVFAQDDDALIEEIITVGTRTPGRTATESPVPVDVLPQEAILNSGAVDTADMLRKLAPSFNMNNTTTSDGQDLMRPATLRSLGPDQVLVLVNGKRRHQQALVAVQENVGRGSAGTDLSSIPLSAIERVEILRDGAAAQYGSDAIAGVINLVLKESPGGNAWSQYRTTSEGDGDTLKAGVHYGFDLGDAGSLNITYEFVDQDSLNRAAATDWLGASPVVDQLLLVGEAEVESDSLWVNGNFKVGEAGEIYAFAGYTQKEGESLGFFRGPNDNRVWSALFPNGVTPALGTESEDTSVTAGYRTTVGDWDMDFSLAWGENRFEFRNLESLNASYGPDSPTSAYDGALVFDQLTFNADVVRTLDVAFAESATLALGFEYREDGYQMEAGDPVSYDRGDTWCGENSTTDTNDPTDPGCAITAPGMQGFQGYRPEMEIDTNRDNVSLYADTELAMTEKLDLGLALRYEDYSDFGDSTNGKISARYELTPQLAVRGAFSTGFRAPGVQQQFFTQRSISLENGVLSDLVALRPDSELAAELGFGALKEETSESLSIGLVYNGDRWTSTLDIYQIDIDDRIVYSGNITAGVNADIAAFFAAHDAVTGDAQLDGVAGVTVFTNAINTETTGMDWVNQWDFALPSGNNLVLEATLHLNNTKVTDINTSSSVVPDEVVFNDSLELLLTDGQPQQRATLAANYDGGDWAVTSRLSYYGEVSTSAFGSEPHTWGAKSLVDLTGVWDITDRFRLSGGILNLFDEFPDEWGEEGGVFPQLGFRYGWTTFPFSLAGREYYVRATLNF